MTLKNSCDACLETLYGLRRFGIILGLSTIRKILEGLGNPQNRFESIHVAGTNGKGSVASALSSILNAAGYKTGLYTSPHLVRFNERCCIGGRQISDKAVVESCEAIRRVHHGDREPTFFEFATAMAFHEFARQQVDWAVVETGMGGRLDATNIIRPAVSIISNISLEHQMHLGNNLAQIASEKGGIIKKNVPVVTGAKQKSVISVLREIARKRSARFYRFGEHFRIRRDGDGAFTYFGIDHTWRDLHSGLKGTHQMENAALALAACEVLRRDGTRVPLRHIRDGLAQNRWPGRLEFVSESPLVLLDGAHNLTAARILARFLSEELSDRKITLVVGILDDKPHKDMLGCLLPLCDKAIITSPRIGRALPPEELYATAKDGIEDIKIIPDVRLAVRHAIRTASPHEDAVCVAGSLYVVGEAKEALDGHF